MRIEELDINDCKYKLLKNGCNTIKLTTDNGTMFNININDNKLNISVDNTIVIEPKASNRLHVSETI